MTTMTTNYLVSVEGATNQYGQYGPVGVFEGTGRTANERRYAAIAAAEADGVTTYIGQHLSARPLSRCSQADIDLAYEAAAIRLSQNQEAEALYAETRGQ